MKTKAAIAYAAGEPLEVVSVELDGSKAGEVLVEIHPSGVGHTDDELITQALPLRKVNGNFGLMHQGELIH